MDKQVRSEKRGIGFNILYEADFAQMKDGISWAYDWGWSGYGSSELTDAAKKNSIAYIPMIHGKRDDANWAKYIRDYKKTDADCMYILSFNEPNLTIQANMTPAQAAQKWPDIKALAQELKMKIIAPAMNYGTLPGYNDPIKWLDEFFAQPGVSLDDVDALALHCYFGDAAAVKNYVECFRKYKKPIWMTEFSAGEGEVSIEQQREYMCNVLNYFESDPIIERYAWFAYDGAATNIIKNANCELRPRGNKTGELTDLGKVYIYFSSFDKKLYYAQDTVIPAEHYSNCNASEMTGKEEEFAYGPQLKVSPDEIGGILEVADADPFVWMEYQIAPKATNNYLLIVRYASDTDSKIKVFSNGREISEIDLPKTGSNTTWSTSTTTISLNAGKQTIRIAPSKGMVSLDWWQYKK
jgi:hypothetical protein